MIVNKTDINQSKNCNYLKCIRYQKEIYNLFHFQTDPKRLKKELPKQLKTIKGEDRLLLVGTSRCPFDGEMKPLTSTYQRIILIPRPDYASRHCKYSTGTYKNFKQLVIYTFFCSIYIV